jgi:hypothetical protein
VVNNLTGKLDKDLDPGTSYRNIVMKYARETGISEGQLGFVCIR